MGNSDTNLSRAHVRSVVEHDASAKASRGNPYFWLCDIWAPCALDPVPVVPSKCSTIPCTCQNSPTLSFCQRTWMPCYEADIEGFVDNPA
jgi:hypothetical protein